MSHKLWRGTLAVGVLLTAAGFYAPPATANNEPLPEAAACGTEVDADFQLQHDIGPCVLDGLVVTASGTSTNPITIDLNGHDIFGTLASDGGAGIRIGTPPDETGAAASGFSYVEVTDTLYTSTVTSAGTPTMPPGEIYDFDACVAINGGSNNTVKNIHCHSNGDGFSPSLYGEGISITDSSDNVVTNLFVGTDNTNVKMCDAADLPGDPPLPNTTNGDGSPKDCGAIPGAAGPFAAITVKGVSERNNIHRNLLKNNYRCFTFGTGSCQSSGVRLEGDGVDNNTVEKNRIIGSGLDGVAFLSGPDSNTIKDNVIEANGFHHRTHRKGDGVRILGPFGATSNSIMGNRVCGNAAYGIRIDAGNTGNSVTSNKVGDGSTTDPINGGSGLSACTDNHQVTASATDMSDGNPGNPAAPAACTTNTWSSNSYPAGHEDPDCIS